MTTHSQGAVLQYDLSGEGSKVLQHVSLGDSEHSISLEGPEPFGGTNSAASPLDHVLAALLSCNQVTSAIVAAGKKATLGAFVTKAHGELDSSVLIYGSEGNPNFSKVEVSIEVETDLDESAFTEFTQEVERRCPVTQLFLRSGVDLNTHWTRKDLRSS